MNRLALLLIFLFSIFLNTLLAQETDEKYDYQTTPFKEINQFLYIKDTITFIAKLRENCHLWEPKGGYTKESINYFKKVKLYGSNKWFYIIEYDFHSWSNASFPWKNQFVFDIKGNLIKILSEIRLDVVKIFPARSPFLFGVSSTGHGNGWHEVYKISSDTLEQVYDGFLGRRPQTYSTGDSYYVTSPHELFHKFADINKDHYADIIFYGKVRYSKIDLGYQDRIIPVKYIFLYNPKTGHFTELEDYSEKYEYIYGNTK